MSTLSIPQEPTDEQTEAYQALLQRLGRKSPKIPADILVRHILRIVPTEEWPTRVEALDALVRRLESGRNDGLRIDSRPDEGRVLGSYATRRKNTTARPYDTILSGIEPIEGRCDCPDFLKNSLGVCKHLLIVLEHLWARPKLVRQGLKEQEARATAGLEGLWWDPIRPLTGPGDWLDRVTWHQPPDFKAARAEHWARARRWFRQGENGTLVLKSSRRDDPVKRLALVEDVLKVTPSSSRDPALRALLIGARERLGRTVKQALPPAVLATAMKGLKRPLYPYQREGVERFLAAGRLLLADDMGLGKTAQAITATDVLWRTRRIRRGLIIAPASLKPQWAREWASFSDLPIQVVDGAPAERQAVYQSRRTGLLIINYEQLIRDLDTIRAWKPDLVVLDEAQRIKNWATKTALSVKGLDPPYRLVLTGTPMENRIEELASVVEWVDDQALEPKWRLTPVHAVYADGRHEMTGVRHLDTLRDRLSGCMIRRIRQDVLDQLPPRTDTRVPIEMTEAQREEHDALIEPIASIIKRSHSRALTQPEFLRLMTLLTAQRIISNGLAQLNFEQVWPSLRGRPPEESVLKGLSSPKLLELRQLVRQIVLEQERKVVIFSQWRRMLSLAHWAVSDLLAGQGLRAGFFTGAEGQRRRTQNIVEFHDDPRHRILFASDAGGVGLNLQHAANCVINLELPWNPAVLEQRIGRIYRIGQSQPIDVYNLINEEGIESRIAGLVGSKQAFFKGLFDGDSEIIQFEQSGAFLSRVETIYGEAANADDAGELDQAGKLDDASGLHLDDDVTDPIEAILADESTDQAETPAPSAPPPPPISEPPAVPAAAPLPTIGEVRHLFSKLQVRREAGGKVVIEAPADAASTLSALFEGMAALLQSVSTPPDGS